MLNTKLVCHDIDDVERFCQWIAKNETSLSPSDKEDLVAYLVSLCWELSLKYEPEGATILFRSYAGSILRNRIVDWKRKTFGDSRYGALPTVYSTDEYDFEIAVEDTGLNDIDGQDIPAHLYENLSEDGLWAFEHIAIPIANGYKLSEIAKEYGRSTMWVNEQLSLVKEEMSHA